jgi:molybdopterin molybdotransferase
MSEALITVDEARRRVLASTPSLGAEPVPVNAALDRILAEDLAATGEVPPFACSAMDGYAVHPGAADRALDVIGESRAGRGFEGELRDGEAVRISTGAAVPSGATAVIRQEDVHVNGSAIHTLAATGEGENVRGAGEDMRAGTTVLSAGASLGAVELAAAVAAGAASLTVGRRPQVAVLCTGDELRAPGEPLGPGEIHNSNAPMLAALAARCGAVVTPSAKLPDDRAATVAALGEALEAHDVVLVSGGVSVGPHDHVKPALAALGVEEAFWRVALQPGKPTWFGTRGERLVFGLPGNPVSAAVTFSLFARPALLAMQGAAPAEPRPARAALGAAVRLNRSREQALRVRLEERDSGWVVLPNGPQGSHMVTSLLGADALAMIPAGDGELAAGTIVALREIPH